jgi:hypothetical protein
MKNETKKYTLWLWPPNDEETHNNQPKDSVGDVERCYLEMRPRQSVWGDDFTSFGAARGNKNLRK